MNIKPTFTEVQDITLTKKYDVIPISFEMLSDFITPIEVMRKLKNVSNHCYLLESAKANETWGRWTFLGYNPKMEITCIGGKLNGIVETETVKIDIENPADYIRKILSKYKSPKFDYLPPFTGGLVGYFEYSKYRWKTVSSGYY